MSQVLTYTVVNAQQVALQREMDVEGSPATVSFQRAVIEAAPTDPAGKTLSVVLPTEALADFPEGSQLTVTIEPAPAAAPAA